MDLDRWKICLRETLNSSGMLEVKVIDSVRAWWTSTGLFKGAN